MTTSVDNFHKFSIPRIRVMQPLYSAARIYVSHEGHVFFIPILNNSVLFSSYL